MIEKESMWTILRDHMEIVCSKVVSGEITASQAASGDIDLILGGFEGLIMRSELEEAREPGGVQ